MKSAIILFFFVPFLASAQEETASISLHDSETVQADVRDKVKKIDKLCVNCLWVTGQLFLNGAEITRAVRELQESQEPATLEIVAEDVVSGSDFEVVSLAAMQNLLKLYGEKIAKLEEQIQKLLKK